MYNVFDQKYFVSKMELLTSEVQAVFQNFISTKGGWISDATKAIANEKIENIARSIGYPDSILDDELLEEEVEEVMFVKVKRSDKFFFKASLEV